MIAYTEVEYGLCKWPITTATPTPAAAVLALSSVGLAASFAPQTRAERPALHSVIANPISGPIAGRSAWAAAGLVDGANAWGFA
jgi:hypothetical protein